MDAAVKAAHSGTLLPKDLAAVVRIESINHAGFLPGQYNVAARSGSYQYRRRSEIEVGAVLFRAIDVVCVAVFAARSIPSIAFDHLPYPANLAGPEFERDDRIAHIVCGRGIVFPGSEVEQPALCVYGRR